MKRRTTGPGLWCAGVLLALWAGAAPVSASTTESTVWSAYLDFAYVYSSADADALRARLKGYGEEAGISLPRYIAEYFETLAHYELQEAEEQEASTRRQAIAYLLDYLARGDVASLDKSLATIRQLGERLDRHENRYWYHYIKAHHSLEKGYAREFVNQLLELWLGVVVPLESTYSTLDTLALSDAPNSGFVSALPYVYENITRLVLIRSQEMGLDRDLDPLGALVRMLGDQRVGAHPDVIPPEASSRAYLERVLERLDGPESDDGSLTFTLALFEASKHHDRARSLLAQNGLSDETLRAMRRTTAGYEIALNRARTPQGEAAVYTRVLRQLGELYAARQRLGVDPELDMPFSIEGAMEVYVRLRAELHDDWRGLGYRHADRQDYIRAMHVLWEEIQETSLNTADYYLTRSVESPHRADEYSRNAARVYNRYLSFFYGFATDEGKESVPESAYFAAFEAARGIGDSYLRYAATPRRSEVEIGTLRYRSALLLFPFDRELWPAIAAALGRHGREAEYMDLVRPIVDRVVRSRSINAWIQQGEPKSEMLAALRGALADSVVVMYLGFAEASGVAELEHDLAELVERRERASRELEQLIRRRDQLRGGPDGHTPAAPDGDAESGDAELAGAGDPPRELADVARQIADQNALIGKLEQQIAARSRGLPLYKQALATDGLADELRTRRDHPVHTLLRRMYHETGLDAEREEDRT